MKSLKFLSFSIAVCMICLLPMTSCSAAEVPAAGKNLTAEPLAAAPPKRPPFRMFPLTRGTLKRWNTAASAAS